MRICVKGTNLAVPEHVREAAIEKLSRVRRLFDHFTDMEIIFREETNPRIHDSVHCEVVLHAKRTYLTAMASGPDALTAIDRVEAKITRQVRKLKTRRVSKPRLVAAGSRSMAG